MSDTARTRYDGTPMRDVDAILAGGRYTDSRGQFWHYDGAVWSAYGRLIPGHFQSRTHDQMRLWIVRDQHRAECPGLLACRDHPVPVVIGGWPSKWERRRPWMRRTIRGDGPRVWTHPTFAEAIAAAHNTTGDR